MYVSSDWTSLPPRRRPLFSHLFCTLPRLYVLIFWYLLLAMGAVGHLLSRDSPLNHASHRRFSHQCVVDGEFRAYVWKGQSLFAEASSFQPLILLLRAASNFGTDIPLSVYIPLLSSRGKKRDYESMIAQEVRNMSNHLMCLQAFTLLV